MELWCPIELKTEGRHCFSCVYFFVSWGTAMAVVTTSILFYSLEFTVHGQSSRSIADNYWIGITGLPLAYKMPLCLFEKGTPLLPHSEKCHKSNLQYLWCKWWYPLPLFPTPFMLGLLLLVFDIYQNHLWILIISSQPTPELQGVEFNKTPWEILMATRVWKWMLKNSQSPNFLLFKVWSLNQQDLQH